MVNLKKQRGLTDEGKALFADWIYQTRTARETQTNYEEWLSETGGLDFVGETITQEQFSRWMSFASGFYISSAALSRCERGDFRNAPGLDILLALVRVQQLKIGRRGQQRSATLQDIADVLTGDLNPFTGERSKDAFAPAQN